MGVSGLFSLFFDHHLVQLAAAPQILASLDNPPLCSVCRGLWPRPHGGALAARLREAAFGSEAEASPFCLFLPNLPHSCWLITTRFQREVFVEWQAGYMEMRNGQKTQC